MELAKGAVNAGGLVPELLLSFLNNRNSSTMVMEKKTAGGPWQRGRREPAGTGEMERGEAPGFRSGKGGADRIPKLQNMLQGHGGTVS